MARKENYAAKKIIREYLQSIKKKIPLDGAFLFGSYARGEQTQASDIDLLIISRRFVRMPFIKRLELLNRLRSGETLTVPMDIIGVTPTEYSGFQRHESPSLRMIYKESKKIKL